MKTSYLASLLTWARNSVMTSKNSPKRYRMLIASFGLFLTATLTTPALARQGSEFFCIYQRENSSLKVVDVYPTTDRSQSWACYEAQRQCIRDVREGQRCSEYSSGEFGYIRERQRIACQSIKSKYSTCNLKGEAVGSVRVANKLSESSCKQGEDWDLNRDGESIWVDRGCRAVFEVEVEYYKEPGVPPQIEARDLR